MIEDLIGAVTLVTAEEKNAVFKKEKAVGSVQSLAL
jgi:hypothetical protein